ncbi:alpha/beta hydrolase [Dyadobacter fanqingshengii]|uniref:Alpha/beta hydrolase n=1 Tax=Dyadobacter fanqingshengii TaxID=2906443 RepID=A0A9X1TCH4_9BACT|nr:alpha/beta hydrolase [Dyadobacter fanqingshengii]MCF0043563.1 alpha/beta hydrolase [Dyadobacter fanqingshengii]USJ34818.1 alpha/beta hydrolase [Dyadobacter fanqingshengii]
MMRPEAFFTMFGIRILLLVCCIFPAAAQTVMPLYPDKIPNAINGPDEETNKDQVIRKVSKPTLTVFLPPAANANGAAVIVCPGGGYGVLVMEWEGYRIAEELNKSGIAAIILKYRLPHEKIMTDKSIGPLQDAQQAIKTVRERAKEWKIDPAKIGIIGFSAGGHLAATAGTHYDSTFISNPEKTSLRPDFMILVYPVISLLDKIGHKGSSSNLLGASPTAEKVIYFSNELQVKKTTPPTYLTHAGDDTVVPVSNSIKFYEALHANGVAADMHIYSKGEHGYPKTPDLNEWFGRCLLWMKTNRFLP